MAKYKVCFTKDGDDMRGKICQEKGSCTEECNKEDIDTFEDVLNYLKEQYRED